MNQRTMWAVVIVVILALSGWWYVSMNQAQAPALEEVGDVAGDENQFIDDSKDSAPAPKPSTSTGGATAGGSGAVVKGATITYDVDGFSPKVLTVKKGTEVTFVDKSGRGFWIGSDEHPAHTGYDGTSKGDHCNADGTSGSFDQCKTDSTYSFTFNKAGTWGYHNHISAGSNGVVIVEE